MPDGVPGLLTLVSLRVDILNHYDTLSKLVFTDQGGDGGEARVFINTDPGRDLFVTTGNRVLLDGRRSYAELIEDATKTNTLVTFKWTLEEKPVDS